jgi:hypothetical protein
MTVSLTIILVGLGTPMTAQERPALFQPYDDADAYEIYNLLLPQEESYTFANDALMIQENTVPEDISGACLKLADAKRFKGAIAGYERIYKKKWFLQRLFKIVKDYRIVDAKMISALPTSPPYPQSAVSVVSMSPVGFNREKTQAVVFVKSSCGGLCGSWQFHFLVKVHGKWNEVPLAGCGGAS